MKNLNGADSYIGAKWAFPFSNVLLRVLISFYRKKYPAAKARYLITHNRAFSYESPNTLWSDALLGERQDPLGRRAA